MLHCRDTPYLGHSAIVFGATSGLGAATALRLAERGANVTLVGRRPDLGKEAAAKCAATGRAGHFIQADIAKDDQVDAAVRSAVTTHGRLTMAANVAATDIAKPLVELTDAAFAYGAAGIRVNQISPGATRTEMLQGWIDMAAASGITMPNFEATAVLRAGRLEFHCRCCARHSHGGIHRWACTPAFRPIASRSSGAYRSL